MRCFLLLFFRNFHYYCTEFLKNQLQNISDNFTQIPFGMFSETHESSKRNSKVCNFSANFLLRIISEELSVIAIKLSSTESCSAEYSTFSQKILLTVRVGFGPNKTWPIYSNSGNEKQQNTNSEFRSILSVHFSRHKWYSWKVSPWKSPDCWIQI